MAIFNSYVSLPEGNSNHSKSKKFQLSPIDIRSTNPSSTARNRVHAQQVARKGFALRQCGEGDMCRQNPQHPSVNPENWIKVPKMQRKYRFVDVF
jgi:hypothetical protein